MLKIKNKGLPGTRKITAVNMNSSNHPVHTCNQAWELIRFRREKVSRRGLFDDPFTKIIERTYFFNSLPPPYLLGFGLHSRAASST